MADLTFRYRPECSVAGCARPPVARIAAWWSYGPLRERKNYGLACAEHRDPLLALARGRRASLVVGDGEQVGPVEVIPLAAADRDAGRTEDRPPGMDPTA